MQEIKPEDLTVEEQKLLSSAKEALQNAFNPVSGILFGAAILTESGQIVKGSSLYTSSTGMHVCAERAAFITANSLGYADIKKLAVISQKENSSDLLPPCGVCRQFFKDYAEISGRDFEIFVSNFDQSKVIKVFISELLPLPYISADSLHLLDNKDTII